MTKDELIKEIKKPGRVYGFVIYTEDDGRYFQLNKADLLFELQPKSTLPDNPNFIDDAEYIANRTDEGLFIG